MVRFFSIATKVIPSRLLNEDLLSVISILDDALMFIYDANPNYYDTIMRKLNKFTRTGTTHA